ncbi:MAG: hypothetical protein ABSG64_09855 [Solirubrobacteraceae bacterium]|jgi:predicted nucleic acid-binding protein
MSLISERTLLVDTGPLCRLAEAGEVHLDVAVTYLREVLTVVMDVHRELRRRSEQPVHARLKRLEQLGVPRDEPITITDASLLSRIDAIVEGRRRHKPGHENEDRGEVATALVAASRQVPALIDDGFGKRLAESERVEVFTTEDLAVELAAVGALKPIHAWGMYRIVYADAKRAEFEARVAALKAKL